MPKAHLHVHAESTVRPLRQIYDWVRTHERSWSEQFDRMDVVLEELVHPRAATGRRHLAAAHVSAVPGVRSAAYRTRNGLGLPDHTGSPLYRASQNY